MSDEVYEAAEALAERLSREGIICGWPSESDVIAVLGSLHEAGVLDLRAALSRLDGAT